MWRKWGMEEKELNKESGYGVGCSEKWRRKVRFEG